jgi:SAM-dependent methyltransferase
MPAAATSDDGEGARDRMMNPAEYANIAKCEKEFWWYRGMERILFRILDPIVELRTTGEKARVVEVGCGTGYMASRLEQRYGWRVFPTDLQHEGLLYGLEHGVQRMAQAEISALPFPDGSFDAVVSLDVMVYIPRGQESRAINELVRVLAPGGLLVLRTAALDLLRSHHAEFTGELQRFKRGQLLRLASENGIKVVRCTYANSMLLPVALAKFRLLEPLLPGKPSSGVEPVAPWLDRILYGALRLEAKWLGSGSDLPIGQSLLLIGERCA